MATTPGDLGQAHRRRCSPAAAPIATGCCLVAGAVYVTAVDPSDGASIPTCPFRAVTGWWCPGCGLTRATHHLFHGDLPTAFRYNLLVVFVLALIVAAWTGWYAAVDRPPAGPHRPHPRLGRTPAAIGLLAVFAVVRNLPAVDGLRG